MIERKTLIQGSSNAEEVVSKPKDVARLFPETKNADGMLDILVNNLGIYDFKPIGENP
jgi:NAD(P)-dependent dehydrogenase (short-subunit alcohol dehydrogenase family)